ncbi:MAG: chromosome segregation protein ScpA [Syntrophobacterales bacterium]|jgi:segregation and condensation protein A|nr:MAG: chromosome segregation protein ScpA [Syntrophobacterales bacterium]
MSYEIKLDIFEGPLDLLLYLIKKNEIDIYDIPVALITKQYLKHIEILQSLNLDLAGEYLVLAATLIHIKSRMLLPVPDDEEAEDEGDPRAELVRQLLEYQAFKEAALSLDKMSILGRDVFGRDYSVKEEMGEEGEIPIREVGIFELVEAFRNAVSGIDQEELMEIDVEKISLSETINQIMDELNKKKMVAFTDLLGGMDSKMRIIYTFLAILELMKMRVIRAYQAVSYGPIRICLAVGE